MKKITVVILVLCLLVPVSFGSIVKGEITKGTPVPTLTLPPSGIESTLALKTISSKTLTSSVLQKTQTDFTARPYKKPDAVVDSAMVASGTISVSASATPRPSGGITIELFCEDNTGRYMPIWGGSITKDRQGWQFSPRDVMRDNIDGCYFAVIDSTAEMQL